MGSNLLEGTPKLASHQVQDVGKEQREAVEAVFPRIGPGAILQRLKIDGRQTYGGISGTSLSMLSHGFESMQKISAQKWSPEPGPHLASNTHTHKPDGRAP